MSNNYYKAAIIIYAVQLFILAILVQRNVAYEIFPPEPKAFMQVLGIAALFSSLFSIFVIRQLYRSSIIARRRHVEILEMKNIEKQNLIYRQHRHDLYNHLTVISGLAQLGKLDSLKSYLASYLDDYNRSIVTVNTGLKELDVILFAKISEARDLGIEVSYELGETVKCSPGQTTRLVAVLANAMDNAIQACVKAGEEKLLGLKISGDLVDYIFEISNTFNPEIADLDKKLQIEGYTSKPGSARGEGLCIMRRKIKKLQGTMRFNVIGNCCQLVIEVPKLALEGKP